MKHLITPLIFLFPITLFANEPQWKSFTQESTVLIAHVDLTKVDIAQTIQNNQPIVDAVLQALPGEPQDVRQIIAAGELGKLYLMQTLGIQEAYIVANIQMSGGFAIVLPQNGKINVETLKSTFATFNPNAQHPLPVMSSRNGEFVVIPGVLQTNDQIEEEWLDLLFPATPMDRPDFAEAFAAVEEAPIKIVAALPNFVRRVVRDTSPRLPSPFDKLDIVTPLSELRWTAIGIDPAKPVIAVTAATTSEFAAARVQQFVQQAIALAIDNMPTRFDISRGVVVEQPKLKENLIKNQARIQSLLVPKPEDKNLVLNWEQSQLDEIFEIASPFIEEFTASTDERIKRQPCSNKMKILLLSFHNHHDSYEKMPPPFTVDANGKPLHSWRVLVLPFLDQQVLYRQIRLDEPWDSEHNKQFHDQMPAIFHCPAGTGNPQRETVYCMIVGNETIGVPDGKGLVFSRITDGMSNTIALTERKTSVNWMEPTDILQEHAYLGVNQHELGIGSEHPGGAVIAFADGSVHFMRENIPLAILKGLLMKAGGASVIYNWEERRPYLESGR